jgi:hypothetical protein
MGPELRALLSPRRLIFIGVLLVVMLGSFFLTLAMLDEGDDGLVDSSDPRSDGERIASHKVTSYSDLRIAARDARLRRSMSIIANVDSFTRINERDVALSGWLADPDGDATPIKLIVFVSGVVAATTQTKGERPDVTKEIGLAFDTEKNVAVGVNFACPAGQQPVVVALGLKRRYFPVDVPRCP